MVEVEQVLCQLEDPKIAQILNREEVYFLVLRGMFGFESLILYVCKGLFMSNSQTYKLPDFLKSQTIFLIDFTVDLSRKSPTILKSQSCFLIWEFRPEQTLSVS